jgi:hypothetical protein
LISNEQKLANRLAELTKCKEINVNEYGVEAYLPSGEFFRFINDIKILKNEFMFEMRVVYSPAESNTLIVFDGVYSYK